MKRKLLFLFAISIMIMGLTGCGNVIPNSAGSNTSTGTNNSAGNPNYSPSELEKKITSSGAMTEQGTLVVFATNKNKIPVNMEIEVEFYDKDGVIAGSDTNSLLAVGAGAEVAVEMWSTPKSFDNYKIFVDVEQTNEISYFDKVELSHNNTGDNIAVQVKNNSEDTIEYIRVSVVYYQGDKVVGVDEDFEDEIKSGRAANLTLDFPYDRDYDDVSFDNYKVFITEAYSYNW